MGNRSVESDVVFRSQHRRKRLMRKLAGTKKRQWVVCQLWNGQQEHGPHAYVRCQCYAPPCENEVALNWANWLFLHMFGLRKHARERERREKVKARKARKWLQNTP